jgi:hypothetical protein
MSKWINDAALDAALNYVRANCDLLIICSQQPTTYTEATSTYALGSVAMTPNTDYTLADGAVDGRQLTVAAKTRVPITVSGTATHIALCKTGDSSLRLVTTCASQAVVAGGSADCPTWKIALADPFLKDGVGPLKVSATNGRYFTDGRGKAIYLTGSQTWYSIVNGGYTDPPPVFDFDAYLNYLATRGHNFFKTFAWQHTKLDNETAGNWYNDPLPFQRNGPGNAGDGKPKFDLTLFNQTYFDNLRAKVIKAGQRGFYVSVQMWYGMDFDDKGFTTNVWPVHPFNVANNINGVNADPTGKGEGEDFATLNTPAVTAVQEAYVRKVIDTVNDLDNVLYEICNEPSHGPLSGAYSTAWQYHFVDYIHTYEASKPKQHPVGMTIAYPGGNNADLDNSNAEWVSYNGDLTSFPSSTGSKVILHDTDHLCGICGDRFWVWKSVCKGLNVCFQDVYDCNSGHAQYWTGGNCAGYNDASVDNLRYNMGWARTYVERMDLNSAVPDNTICSTGFCLKHTNAAYLCYQPATNGASFTLNLSAASGTFTVEWFRPSNGTTTAGGTVSGGATRTLTPPASIDYVAYVYK